MVKISFKESEEFIYLVVPEHFETRGELTKRCKPDKFS
jgi:hypothetical protein